MKRLVLPHEQDQPPPARSFQILDLSGPLLLLIFFGSFVPFLLMDLSGTSGAFGWTFAHHLHWMVVGITLCLLVWWWRPLRWRRLSAFKIMAGQVVLTLGFLVRFASAVMVVNALNFASPKPVAGTVVSVLKYESVRSGRKTRRVELRQSDGTSIILPLNRDEWDQAVEGGYYQKDMRHGLLGIFWCWSWE